MKSLDELVRAAAAGGITHLTLYPVPSEDNKTVYWMARATPSTQHRFVQEINTDPVAALAAVLTAVPKVRRAVTAAVKRAAPPEYTEPLLPTETTSEPVPEPEAPPPQPEPDEWEKFK